jgi:hypothetical protein
MSRTRLIRPEFYKDELMAGASISTRFVYIGLWTLCDDAGYFERKPHQIAAELFPYDGLARRQRLVDKALAELVELHRVRYLDCGVHGVVPTLPKHGAKGGTKAETYLSRHRTGCSDDPVRTQLRAVHTESTYESSSDSVSGSGSDSDSEGAQARTKKRLMAAFRRQGLPVETA